jgi:hypothetical protein
MGGSCYQIIKGPSWPWSYGSWDYLCNQCLSPLMLWVRIPIRARCTTLCDKVCQWLGTDRWFSPGPPVSSINKADHHDITEILLKMAWNTSNKQTNKQTNQIFYYIMLWSSDLSLVLYRGCPFTNNYKFDSVDRIYPVEHEIKDLGLLHSLTYTSILIMRTH